LNEEAKLAYRESLKWKSEVERVFKEIIGHDKFTITDSDKIQDTQEATDFILHNADLEQSVGFRTLEESKMIDFPTITFRYMSNGKITEWNKIDIHPDLYLWGYGDIHAPTKQINQYILVNMTKFRAKNFKDRVRRRPDKYVFGNKDNTTSLVSIKWKELCEYIPNTDPCVMASNIPEVEKLVKREYAEAVRIERMKIALGT